MVKLTLYGLGVGYEMARNLWGVVVHPYLTWKKILRDGRWGVTWLLMLLVSTYFGISEPIRWGNIRWNGIYWERVTGEKIRILAELSGLRVLATLVSYLVVIGLMTGLSWWWKRGKVNPVEIYARIFKVWGYTYFPTVIWFLMTAGLFAWLPPPRHITGLGILFSTLFLGISAGLLVWKGLLYVLTLKLAAGLSLRQIFWSSVVLIPLLAAYSRIMYMWGIFRIPFV